MRVCKLVRCQSFWDIWRLKLTDIHQIAVGSFANLPRFPTKFVRPMRPPSLHPDGRAISIHNPQAADPALAQPRDIARHHVRSNRRNLRVIKSSASIAAHPKAAHNSCAGSQTPKLRVAVIGSVLPELHLMPHQAAATKARRFVGRTRRIFCCNFQSGAWPYAESGEVFSRSSISGSATRGRDIFSAGAMTSAVPAMTSSPF